jgi:hypothetical protein
VVNLDGIHTVRKSHIGDRIASLDEGKVAQIELALLFALGMDHYARGAFGDGATGCEFQGL